MNELINVIVSYIKTIQIKKDRIPWGVPWLPLRRGGWVVWVLFECWCNNPVYCNYSHKIGGYDW